MSSIRSALKLLAQGHFICGVHFPEEYESLREPEGRAIAERWLGDIGYRLARLHDEGAFFMAHAIVTNEMRNRFREEMRNARSRLEPTVGFLELIRQAQGRDPRVHAGDVIWESEICEAVRVSSILEQRLMDMREIGGARLTDSVNDRVRRMLDQLKADGYLVESNVSMRGFTLTGKVDYIYQLIGYIAANTPHLSDEDVVDAIDDETRQARIEDAVQTESAGDGSSGGVSGE